MDPDTPTADEAGRFRPGTTANPQGCPPATARHGRRLAA